MDFGIARIAGGEALTAAGEVVGTLAYMSPEQAEGAMVGPPSDVYSLGLTLYELWAGENPVAAPTPAETVRRIGAGPPSLREHRPDLPEGLVDAIDACLDPEPDLRPDPAELRDRLEAELDRLDSEGAIPSPADDDGAPPPRAAGLAATATVFLIALVLPAAGLGAAGPALAALAPRAVIRGILGSLCWAWALIVDDAALTSEALPTGLVFAGSAVALGAALSARHVPVALVGTLLWAASYDAALRLVAGGGGPGATPLLLAGAGAAVVAVEFLLLRDPDPERASGAEPSGRRALSGRLA